MAQLGSTPCMRSRRHEFSSQRPAQNCKGHIKIRSPLFLFYKKTAVEITYFFIKQTINFSIKFFEFYQLKNTEFRQA